MLQAIHAQYKHCDTHLSGRSDKLQPPIFNSLSDVSDDTTFGSVLR